MYLLWKKPMMCWDFLLWQEARYVNMSDLNICYNLKTEPFWERKQLYIWTELRMKIGVSLISTRCCGPHTCKLHSSGLWEETSPLKHFQLHPNRRLLLKERSYMSEATQDHHVCWFVNTKKEIFIIVNRRMLLKKDVNQGE